MKRHLSAIYIFTIGLLLRGALPVAAWMITHDPAGLHTQDTSSYLIPAIVLLREHRFAAFGIPEIIRTPGYPLLLIPGIIMGHVELATIILQIGVSLGTVYLVYRLGLRLFRSRPAALFAAGLYAIEPLSVLYSAKLMTETAFTFLITLAILLLLDSYRSWYRLCFAAMAIVGGIYLRPIAYYLPFAVIGGLVFIGIISRVPAYQVIIRSSVFLVICCVLILPWQVRNYRVARYAGFSAIVEIDLFYFHLPALLPGQYVLEPPSPGSLLTLEHMARIRPELGDSTQGQIAHRMRVTALRMIRANLPRFAFLQLKGILRTMLGPGANEYIKLFRRQDIIPDNLSAGLGINAPMDRMIGVLRGDPAYLALNLMLGFILVFYFLLAGYPVMTKAIDISPDHVMVILFALYLILMSGGVTGCSRFRHPVMPLLCLYAGYGLHLLSGFPLRARGGRRA